MGQVGLALVVLAIIAAVLFVMYRMRAKEEQELTVLRRDSLESLDEIIKAELTEATREDETPFVGDADYEAVVRTKQRCNESLNKCIYGIPVHVATVNAMISSIIEKEKPSLEDINRTIDFGSPEALMPQWKWEALVYFLNKKLAGTNETVIGYLEKKYEITAFRKVWDGKHMIEKRIFTTELLNNIFETEVSPADFTYTACVDILTIIEFSRIKGLGCVNTLRYMPIDGFHFGAGGSVRFEIEGNFDLPFRYTNSVCVQINAKWTHFEFLDFGSVDEMYRVVDLLGAWGNAAPMNEKNARKVNDAYDGSRITTIRPPAGENPAAFIRGFALAVCDVSWWLNNSGLVSNWELPRELLYWLMRAEETTFVCGQQNTGKTKLMASIIGDTKQVNIRVMELAFELALREAYPGRDIYTVRPTEWLTSSDLQDVLKKTDAYLSMVGEIQSSEVAARCMQFGLVAAAFTIASYHGIDDDAALNSLAESLVSSKEYNDHEIAMSTVLDVVKNFVHTTFVKKDGKIIRGVGWISEVKKESVKKAYPEIEELLKQARGCVARNDAQGLSAVMLAYTKLTREYYSRTTDRVQYSTRKIVVFNEATMSYEPREWYSEEAMKRMLEKLDVDERRSFLKFYYKYWRPDEVNPFEDAETPNIFGGESNAF